MLLKHQLSMEGGTVELLEETLNLRGDVQAEEVPRMLDFHLTPIGIFFLR